jgi:CelD/BcsL family acetyltransferase involved in cellulose biosynthesis
MEQTPERPDPALWKTLCDADPHCTYFQTPSWAELVTSLGLGWRDATVLVRCSQGGEAIVPRLTRRAGAGLFRAHESVPPGVYGAPVVGRGTLGTEQLAMVARLFGGLRSAGAVLTEVPGQPLDLGARRETKTTHLLRFVPGECEETLLARYRKGHRNDVLKARRSGVAAALAACERDIDGYERLYRETVTRWKRAPHLVYPRSLFRRLHVLAQTGERIRIWLSRRGEELLAGVVVLVHGRHAAYWHAASSDAGREVHAGHVALHAAIVDALSLGAQVFDFMPSGGLAAVERFKEGFDAAASAVGVHLFAGSPTYRMLRSLRNPGSPS